jgi:hypothetical protein
VFLLVAISGRQTEGGGAEFAVDGSEDMECRRDGLLQVSLPLACQILPPSSLLLHSYVSFVLTPFH